MNAVRPLRAEMPMTAAFIDALRDAFGRESIDQQIRLGMAGESTFYAQENGRELGTLATITPSTNVHVFSERELDDMGARR